ncbi:WG repeat-containing protein [Kordia sp.]|uniref:WG repeat-containing protein n=1 Tax=Kordia sp. TaxID=1965332 RepID=UPI003D6A6AC4
MKRFTAIIILLSIVISAQGQSQKTSEELLFRIIEDDLWGFMDKEGTIVIQPQFREVGYFSDGLATVLKNGMYGFIDKKLNTVIPTKYDLAYPFHNGMAKVYLDGKPLFIDTKGNIVFEHDFKHISRFSENGFATVVTKDKKSGIIDRRGNIIIEPVYKRLHLFEDEAVVIVEKENREYGILDLKGNSIVPLNTYDRIDPFINGLAYIEYVTDDETEINDYNGFIDNTGKLILKIKDQAWKFDYDEEYFSENLGVVQFFKKNPDSIQDWQERRKNKYLGFIDTRGKIIKKDTAWTEISSFSKGRAFVKNRNTKRYRMIDTKGNYVSSHQFVSFSPDFNEEMSKNFFDNDEIYVSDGNGWGMINRNGEYTVPLSDVLGESDYDGYQQIGDYLIFNSEEENVRLFGICNLKTNLVILPKYNEVYEILDDLIIVEQDKRITYITTKGAIIWQEAKATENDDLKTVNTLAMNRGYFYASSPSVDELNGLGGWGGSDHAFQKIKAKHKLSKNTFGISVDTESIVPHFKEYKGHKLYVYNTTKDSIFFDAQDSRLYMNVQAKDSNGDWKDIEYLPSSWCGNSYHNLFLAKNSFWEFTIPKYEGAFQTKLRVKLLYKTNHKDKDSKIVYSDEFDGSVNPAQFWYKGSYTRSGIMDPYND